MTQKIIILDFGSQTTQLIGRRVRELDTFCEILPYNKFPKDDPSVIGVILSGSPYSVHDPEAFKVDLSQFVGRVPVLGICYGAQFISHTLGGRVEKADSREYGRANLQTVDASNPLFKGFEQQSQVWMSHGDTITAIPDDFKVIGSTADVVNAAFASTKQPIWAVQFHPEVLLACNDDPVWKRFYERLSRFAGTRRGASQGSDPIGVFDSGIGGLSVLEKILTLDSFDNATGEMRPDGVPDFLEERFVYFGDQANMPYGRYDAAGKADFLRELVVRDAQFVLGSQGHDPSKAVVVACNTATAYGFGRVSAMVRPGDASVIGVVNAGVEGALDAMRGETRPYAIGVMATPATISSGVYERTLRAGLAARGTSVPVEIANRGGIGLAEAVENSEPGMGECARTNFVALVEDYRARGGKAPIRAIILGCTHYPFVLDEFRAALADLRKRPECAALIADDVVFVDPAVNTAVACYKSLRERGLLATRRAADGRRRVEAFISVGKSGPLPDSVKYGREVGSHDIGTKIVPMTADNMPSGAPEMIRAMMPASAAAVLGMAHDVSPRAFRPAISSSSR
jgi:GMP synthase (glutamine-hydrolysing) A subunit